MTAKNSGSQKENSKTEHHKSPAELDGKAREYYNSLIDLRDQLVGQLHSHSSSRSFHGEPGEDLADIGSENFSRDTDLSLMSEEGRKIMLINEAIDRLFHGEFGICFDCGGKIAEGRLNAIPYAKLCIECKAEREKNGGLPPEHTAKEIVET